MTSRVSDKLLVCAIDFGTTYSGYAFSLRDKPMDIQTPQTWYTGNTQLASIKAPTCLLIKSDGEKLFGYEAENAYTDLTLNDDHHDCYFFQHFKMMLHKKNDLSRSTKLDDISGKSMTAVKVFGYSIEFFKKHLLDTRGTGVDLSNIEFVITVPAIWSDSAKQFMREAAVEAGLKNEQISLALEPEVASVFCQQVPIEKMATSTKFEEAKAGTKYMVVDIGGGTTDITVHRIEDDGSLNALHAPTGGPWGGLLVNNKFLEIFTELVGDDVMKRFKLEETWDYYDFIRGFESKKRSITHKKEESIVIRIPASLRELYANLKKRKFEEAIDTSRHKEHMKILRDRLKVDTAFIKQLFEPSISLILNHVKGLMKQPQMKDVGLMLLVGGYSECPLMHRAFLNMFGEKRVVIPHEAGLAVIKGAVQFGHHPSVISSRVLLYTYGTDVFPIFVEGIHPEIKKITDTVGQVRCKGVFSAFKYAGEIVKVGEVVSKIYYPVDKAQSVIRFEVYVSTDRKPKFTTDNGCIKLGKLKINLPSYAGEDREVNCDFVFGHTEFMVEVTEKTSKTKVRKYFDLPE